MNGCNSNKINTEKQRKNILKYLEKKYPDEEFVPVLMSNDTDFLGRTAPSEYTYPKDKGEEWMVIINNYNSDGYMLKYKYEDIRDYIRAFLENLYGEKIYLWYLKYSDDYIISDSIKKDTNIRKTLEILKTQEIFPMHLGVCVSDDVLKDKTIEDVVYEIGIEFIKHNIDTTFSLYVIEDKDFILDDYDLNIYSNEDSSKLKNYKLYKDIKLIYDEENKEWKTSDLIEY